MSKQSEIKAHLLSGQPITGLLAIDLYGVYRLSSAINRIRNQGVKVKTSMIIGSDGKTMHAKYWIQIKDRKIN